MRRTVLNSGWSFSDERWLRGQSKYGFSTLEWLPATVPGHVHLDLVQHGIIADPFLRLYELGCQWVDDADWHYKTSFDVELDAALPKRVLRFAGLDTVCSVFLNGTRIAEHDNMFVPLEVDVSHVLRTGQNELRVEFRSATRVGFERRAAYLASEGLPTDLVRFDERAFVRKAQYMFGWDWGPRLVSAGIWGDVQLLEYGARLLDVHAQQEHRADGSVALALHSEIDGGPAEVVHFLGDDLTPLADAEVRTLEDPKLWWPAGFGSAHLYTVTTLLLPPGSARSKLDRRGLEQRAIDRRVQRLGLRTIRLLRADDEYGQSFQFEVNGRKLWAVGANWIPESSFPAAVSRVRVHAQLARARDMNMNMLRVWGGGLYESDDFYDACDELGVLVWQDFPYACSYYPDGEQAQEVARWEASSAVRRLRNRPSLAVWCGNNENLTMFESKWDDVQRHPPRYYGEKLYDGVLPEVLARLDPDRPYVPSSPWGGKPSNCDGVGDQHYWDVWHGRGDWKHYEGSRARFASEFGFAAAPGHDAWKRLTARVDALSLSVRDAAARWHDKTAKGYETFIGYVELHYPVACNLEEWSYFSQLNQRDALRHGIEHYRRSEFCKGSLIWQLNDCWPVQSWSVLDSEFQYKAAAYELRRLYAPALVSMSVDAGEARVWAVLDNAESSTEGRLSLEARSLADGRVLSSWYSAVRLEPGTRKLALAVSLSELEGHSSAIMLVASWLGSTTHRLLVEPKDVCLAEPRIVAHVSDGGIELESDVPIIDLFLWDPAGELRFDDNFVTLPAAGAVRLRTRGRAPTKLQARSLRGAHTVPVDPAR